MCSTLSKRTSCCCVFSTHQHQAAALVQHTQSVSAPIRHHSDKERSVQSQASRQTSTKYIYIANTRYQVHTYAVYSYMRVAFIHSLQVTIKTNLHACGVCRLFSWLEHGGALGIFKSPVCTYLQSSRTFLCPLRTILPSRASVAGGVCRPRSEAPCTAYDCNEARPR